MSGTLVGVKQSERLVEIDGFDLEIELAAHLAFLTYEDRPGIVGQVGRILGDADINIAGMQVSRDRKGGKALVALSASTPASPPTVLDDIATAVQADTARTVDLEA